MSTYTSKTPHPSQKFVFEWGKLYYTSNCYGFNEEEETWITNNIYTILAHLSSLVDGLLEMEFADDPDHFQYETNLNPIILFVEAILDKNRYENIIDSILNGKTPSYVWCDLFYTCMLKIMWYKRLLKKFDGVISNESLQLLSSQLQDIHKEWISMIDNWSLYMQKQLETLKNKSENENIYQNEFIICKELSESKTHKFL
jgi:general stress protein CsbA